jgi:hypothetical protein
MLGVARGCGIGQDTDAVTADIHMTRYIEQEGIVTMQLICLLDVWTSIACWPRNMLGEVWRQKGSVVNLIHIVSLAVWQRYENWMSHLDYGHVGSTSPTPQVAS